MAAVPEADAGQPITVAPNWSAGLKKHVARSDQFVPAQCVAYRSFDFGDSLIRQTGNSFDEPLPRNRPQVIAIHDAWPRQAFFGSQRHFNRYVADGGRDFGGDVLAEKGIRIVACEEQDRAASGWLGEFGPPDFVLLQDFHASAFDQSSESAAESGCFRYASRIWSYSRLRIASLTALRMNSARRRLAGGAMASRDFRVRSSSWINIDGIYSCIYDHSISSDWRAIACGCGCTHRSARGRRHENCENGILERVKPISNTIMTITMTVDKSRRVVIPKVLRDEMHPEPGDSPELESGDESITLRPSDAPSPLPREQGLWLFRAGRHLSAAAIDRTLQELRKEHDIHRCGPLR